MCGICGIVNVANEAPVDERIVPAMCRRMRHRGPDGTGFLRRPNLHLGHVRLSIIDLAGGKQPLANEDESVHVVFNGEIYNYKDLRGRLEGRGHVFRTQCDTEVLVHLYEDYGREMLDHLLGDFAFAIWDERRELLLLARDHLGVKPLHYAVADGRLYFASEMSALMTAPAIPRELDFGAIQNYMRARSIGAPRTIYRNVHKLLPGHWLQVRHGQVSVGQYWDVPLEPDEARSEEDFAEELRMLIDDAVGRQLMSDVPLGAFLSGGVDSSTVVASMVPQHQGPVKTFSIGFEEAGYDESPYYKPLVRQWDVEHHEFVLRPNLLEIIPKLVEHFGEPCAVGSAIPLYYLAKMAREHVTVTLSGDGGDEVFGGYNVYNYHRWISLLEQWGGRLLAARWIGTLLNNLHWRVTTKWGKALIRAQKIHRLLNLPRSIRMRYMGYEPESDKPLLCQMPDAIDVPDYQNAYERANHRNDWLAPLLYADMKTLLPDEMFLKLDRMTMANSMEGRVPLVDYRLVELAGRIPSRLKIKHGEVKAILKKSQRSRLPGRILRRPKVGFRLPIAQWFRGPLRPMVHDLLTDASFRHAGIYSPSAVERLLQRHMCERENLGNEILCLVMFETWRRNLHERAPLADLPVGCDHAR
jgi:asparagine synthase (glutamine-hydrolysing)